MLGTTMALLGVALAGSAVLPWYSADLPGGSLTAAGVEVSGELWLLPLFGAAILVAGVAVVARAGPVAREWAGAMAIVSGALASLLAVRAAYFAPVEVTVRDASGASTVAVASETLPLAALSIAAAIAAMIVGGVVRRSARRERATP
ncbi:MAG: hypothetical protein OER93_07905 [Thermoleophilia bacterium]|nr:hypothetical protein [Thermoleophilia bacterium]